MLTPFPNAPETSLTCVRHYQMFVASRRETFAARRCYAVVPKYYFHLLNDLDVPDLEGTDFPDLDAARAYAVTQVRGTFSQTVQDEGRVVLHHRIDIEDEAGNVLDTVYFRDAVTVEE